MLDYCELQNFRPLIVTPSHNYSVFLNYLVSVLDFVNESRDQRMALDFHFMGGESLITRARNGAVALFMSNENWTHLVWIDADIGFRPRAIFRLLLSGYDVAAGIYPLKIEMWPDQGVPAGLTRNQFINMYARYPVNTGYVDDDVIQIEVLDDGFMKLREAPTGLMCIKRDVFKKLIDAYPDLKYTTNSIGATPGEHYYRFFDTSIDPLTNRYLSEDYTFCRLWERLGGAIYVDAASNLTHHGFKTYTGDYPATMRLNLGNAVGVPGGRPIHASGLNNLEKNMG